MYSTPWSPDYKNLCKLSSVEEVKQKILEAKGKNQIIRVAGAQHSIPQAVFDDREHKIIHVKLEDKLREITLTVDSENGIAKARVGAGCNLGIDPSDPDSNEHNSFTRTIQKAGYALPILGGMSHQTIGGFISTSSAGGSLKYCLHESLESIEWIDGNGNEHISTADQTPDEFYAVGVSMGLFGIITYVTLTLQKAYYVSGDEVTIPTKESFLSDAATFKQHFDNYDYVHGVSFPQQGVDRVLQFTGKQASIDGNQRIEYHHPLQKSYMDYAAALALYVMNELEHEADKGKKNPIEEKILRDIFAGILDIIMPLKEKNHFCDFWYIALPNDDQALIDTIIRVQFTEIWIDMNDIELVFHKLKTIFADPDAGGNFGVEIYATKQSKFWMSQSYGHNVIRIDPYWWEFNPTGNIKKYYEKFWKELLPIPSARLHWGKHFPEINKQYGDKIIGPEYVKKTFPKFDDWMKLRNQFDPHQIFVTQYWRDLLGISKISKDEYESKIDV